MSNPVETASPDASSPRHWAIPVAIGLGAAVAGSATAAWHRHSSRTEKPGGLIHRDAPGPNENQPIPMVAATSPAVLDLKHVVTQRPALTVVVTAVIVAALTTAVVMFATAPGLHDSTPTAPSITMPPAKPTDPVIARSARIPMSQGAESSGYCTAHGACTGDVFTMDLAGHGPWMVTRVGYRPGDILPGRRVTHLRWELRDTDQRSDRDTVAFDQIGDAHDADVIYVRLRGQGHRAMRITAVVEASVPDEAAVRTGLGPFEVYGYPIPANSSGETEFPTTPFTLSRIEMIPGTARPSQ
ncbi:Uncharacterised protein [Mycobacteroides abscessus subsp. massiliense]|nr:Uncharacterised protein [Mycobacteroides abscessus subsp. massiliense]